jgi:glutamyl-Q tRNA(Asp) synthetase
VSAGGAVQADAAGAGYTGRFAPSPTGDLHLGSLYTAAASYLDARAHGGRWLLRIEDLDRPREVPGSCGAIQSTLETFGFEWDGPVIFQSARRSLYADALDRLDEQGLLFACSCSRQDLAEDDRYPGTCRDGVKLAGAATGTRLRVEPRHIHFIDHIQGQYRQDVAAACGDLLLKRRDSIYAYLLAVVVDDADAGITRVLRGADLLDNTPRQIYLQQALELHTPSYAHVPLICEPDGAKLAKSRRSLRLDADAPLAQLLLIFDLLGLDPPVELRQSGIDAAWRWAIAHWELRRVPKALCLPLPRASQWLD